MELDVLKLTGTVVDERYRIERVVGEGGFAIVYRAQHLIWQRPVAIKVFRALRDLPLVDRARFVEEFVREGALMADLSARSSAIVQARDTGMLTTPGGDELPYTVLEWLDGESLEEVMVREQAEGLPARSIRKVLELLAPVGEALAIAHERGIVHRDIKPENIFVIGDARGVCTVKLLDFGIAKVVSEASELTGFRRTTGELTSFTPAYGSPEQFSRSMGATGPWTDVFALALIATELVSGKPALSGETFVQLAVSAQNPNDRPTPRSRGAIVTDEIEAVFAQALEPDPTKRLQSARIFWERLTAAASALPTSAVPAALVASVPSAGGADLSKSYGRIALLAVVAALGAAGIANVSGGKNAAPSDPPRTVASTVSSASASAPATPARVAECAQGMLPIPGARFFMGNDAFDNEKPAHQVTLAPYCIDRFEVTVRDYKACSDTGGCKRAPIENDWPSISKDERATYDPVCNMRDPSGRADHPVNCVDWDLADKFCHEQGKRLPTEAEWEFAARGPDGRTYPWGDELPGPGWLNACGSECLLWGKQSKAKLDGAMYKTDDGFSTTAPVGSFPNGKSRYGVEDVVGNVFEWTSDWHAPYTKDEVTNPKGGAEGERRVMRGGAWNAAYVDWVRPSFRFAAPPTLRSHGVGFRCVADRK